MTEAAIVVKTEGDYAIVSVDKKDECAKCGMCVFPKNASKIELRAKNDLNVAVGDEVVIEREEGGKLTAACLAFLVPLLLIGLASLITYLWIDKEIFILVLSVAFIAIWYAVLAVLDKKFVFLKTFAAKITAVSKKSDATKE